jgi:hypothetical protein
VYRALHWNIFIFLSSLLYDSLSLIGAESGFGLSFRSAESGRAEAQSTAQHSAEEKYFSSSSFVVVVVVGWCACIVSQHRGDI